MTGQLTWTVSTVAGSTQGVCGAQFLFCEDADGTGTEAKFTFPNGITMDSAGNLYVADMEAIE